MASYIGQLEDCTKNLQEEGGVMCQGCHQYSTSTFSYCEHCCQVLCSSCCNTHTNLSSTKNHRVLSLRQFKRSRQQQCQGYIHSLEDHCDSIEVKLAANKQSIDKTHKAFTRKFKELDSIKEEIIEKVEEHHNKLVSVINQFYNKSIDQLETQARDLNASKASMKSRMGYISNTCESDDMVALVQMLKDISPQVEEELEEMQMKLEGVETEYRPPQVRVVKGVEWDPDTSTTIEVDDAEQGYSIIDTAVVS